MVAEVGEEALRTVTNALIFIWQLSFWSSIEVPSPWGQVEEAIAVLCEA